MKKLLAFLLTCAMLLSLSIPGVFAEPDTTDFSDYTEISSLDQLLTGNVMTGKYVLTNDIDCTGATSRILLGSGAILDGNGHRFINHSGGALLALLSGGELVIRNVDFGTAEKPFILTAGGIANDDPPTVVLWENVNLFAESTSEQVGCYLTAVNGKHTFESCTVTVNAENNGAGNAGGWIGYTNNASVDLTWRNCAAYGKLTSTYNTRSAGYVANLTNQGKYTFENCSNYINVTTSSRSAAGFIAWADSSDIIQVSFTNCRNYGTIAQNYSGTDENHYGNAGFIGRLAYAATLTDCTNYGAVSGSCSNGGLVGYADRHSLSLMNCTNYGSVHSDLRNVGGLIGLSDKCAITISGCQNSGAVNAARHAAGMIGWVEGAEVSITTSINRGRISSADNTAGFIAENNGIGDRTRITNCLNTGSILSSGGNIGGFIGYSDARAILTACANIGKVELTEGSRCANFVGGGNAVVNDSYAFGSVSGPNANAFMGGGNGYWSAVGESTGNRYLIVETEYTAIGSAEQVESVADAVSLLSERYAMEFMPDLGEKTIVLATPVLRAVQETQADADGFQKLRFIAVIDSVNYKYVGFQIKTAIGDEELTARDDQYCRYVYQTITATEQGETLRYEAEEMGGNYIYALSVNRIPATAGTVTFEVTPFATDADGQTRYCGTAYTVVYCNGEFVSAAPVTA